MEDFWRAGAGAVSVEAAALCASSDIIDLHLDSFIWQRMGFYDLHREHGAGWLGGRYFSQADLPRVRRSGMTGATWVITTNPARGGAGRSRAFFRNLERLSEVLEKPDGGARLVRNAAEYTAARAEGLHAAFLGVQGGNALDHDLADLDRLADGRILRITLVHLTSSSLGVTSSPLRLASRTGLGPKGREYIERLGELKIFLDLAHVHPRTFDQALEVHDPSLPFLVTHTGVCGVYPHWRNLDDQQLRAVANSGGLVGIMFHAPFLGPRGARGPERVIDHLAHVVDTIGEDHAAIGSDWDGAIVPAPALRDCGSLPLLVEAMLRRKWSPARIEKILAGNFLRVLSEFRG